MFPPAPSMGWRPLRSMVQLRGVFLLYGEYSDVIRFQRVDMILFPDLYRENQEDK